MNLSRCLKYLFFASFMMPLIFFGMVNNTEEANFHILTPLEIYKDKYYVNPSTGRIMGNLKSSISPQLKVYEIDNNHLYLASGTLMAKFGVFAAFYDKDWVYLGCDLSNNGKRKDFESTPLQLPRDTKYVVLQGSMYKDAELMVSNDKIKPYVYSNSEKELLDRVNYFIDCKWTPKLDVPNNQSFFEKDIPVVGLPYSSVKEYQKFIGLDLSRYTFLTAVNNPYSLLYTQNVAAGDSCYLGNMYHGINSACFYGAVCSSFIAYCFGDIYNYTSTNLRNGVVPGYKIKKNQEIGSLRIGDIWWNNGHEALITNVIKDEVGNVLLIELSEFAGIKGHKTLYTVPQFKGRMMKLKKDSKDVVFYQNTNFSEHGVLNGMMYREEEEIDYNNDLCTWFGDKACIADWDKILINYNSGEYSQLLIFKNGDVCDTINLSNTENFINYSHKGEGLYKACLIEGERHSDFIHFEIVDTRILIFENGNNTEILFESMKCKPQVIYWCNLAGSQLSTPHIVTPEELEVRKVEIENRPTKEAKIRVIFKGKYGRAINDPNT